MGSCGYGVKTALTSVWWRFPVSDARSVPVAWDGGWWTPEIRYRLAWDGKLVSAVLAVFLRVVYGWYRRQAKEQGHADGRCGSVSFVQRFGSALNLNSHYHVLMPDGFYVTGEDGTPTFVRAPQLTDDEVRWIVETTAKRVV